MTTPEMKPLLSIPEEAALCRKAWKDMPVGTMAWHCHHEALSEVLTEPAENRIAYILSDKPNIEQALRLRLFRPAPTFALARAEYKRVQALALAEYERVEALALAEYKRVQALARAEYKRVQALALAEYERVEALALAEYKRVQALARAEYKRVQALALAEYERVEALALAEYKRVQALARAEYKRVQAPEHAKCCPDCPWNGHTIFPRKP